MNLVEFAEKVSQIPLNNCQKKFLEAYEQAEKDGKQIAVCFPGRAGRSALLKIIEEWNALKIK